jgi:hypothetical protein
MFKWASNGSNTSRSSPISPNAPSAFYTDALGFTVKARDRIERSGLGVPIDLVYLDLGGTVVELIASMMRR